MPAGMKTERRNIMKSLRDMYYAMVAKLVLLKNDEKGQTLVEYALIIVVIALLVIAAMKLLEGGIANTYNNAASKLATP
jgi:Flp pilus assembly pilin Flp